MDLVRLYKYSGAGNDFVMADGRNGKADGCFSTERIVALCDRSSGFRAADGRIGSDGLIVLHESEKADFRMEFFNPDGSGGMMCGNGGRCIVAFASFLGITPGEGGVYRFEAADGMHTGEIVRCGGDELVVRLGMSDASGFREVLGGYFLNTGTRHFVLFREDAGAVDVSAEGPIYRHDPEFAPIGANVNFVSVLDDGSLKVRTFEKGVEAETLACGTGIVASAIAANAAGKSAGTAMDGQRVRYSIHARIADLSVDFIPESPARDIFLTGPVTVI